MGLRDFGITTGHEHYAALQVRYPDGLKWLRKCIGDSVDVDNGLPTVTLRRTKQKPPERSTIATYNNPSPLDALIQERLAHFPLGERREHFVQFHDDSLYPVTNEGEGIAYSIGMTSLVEPWGDMLSAPYRDLNREISRYAGSYNSPGYNPLTDYEKLVLLLVRKIREIVEAREEKIKRELKNKKNEDQPSCEDAGLGRNMDNSEAAKEARREKMLEARRTRQNALIELHLSEIAFGKILENADVGYLLLILTSNDIGLTHPNDSVREGAINIITTLVKVILDNFDRELSDNTYTIGEKNKAEKSKCVDDALSLLECTSRALNVNGYGVNDRNQKVRKKATELDNFAIDAGRQFQELKQLLMVV